MEEDIEIAKEIQWNCIHLRQYKDEKAERKGQAIENILNKLEQDEKIIKEMAKELRTRQYNCYGKSVETIVNEFRKKCE